VPFAPVNYRLNDDRLRDLLVRLSPAVVVVEDDAVAMRVGGIDGPMTVTPDEFLRAVDAALEQLVDAPDPGSAAILIFTSGTSGPPKCALLLHRHLTSYVFDGVEFMSADAKEATLTSVPPYHIAGVPQLLSGVFPGRRIVPLSVFDPGVWVEVASQEAVSHMMVVATMLYRILGMPVRVIKRALTMLPHVDFVDAYGLTETASTIAGLAPDDHREAHASSDPDGRAHALRTGWFATHDDAKLAEFVRARLRSTRTAERFARWGELPDNEMGKLRRREVRARLRDEPDATP
jgi:fatty-acyl-CoA synthase